MIEFVVMVVERGGRWCGLGTHKFRTAPHVGHVITMNDPNGIGQAYEVVAVIHPLEPTSTAGDLVLRHIGTNVDFHGSLEA